MPTLPQPTSPQPTPAPTPLSQGLIDSFIDALWLEDGLSQNTLAAYRRDLTLFAGALAQQGLSLDGAGEAHIQQYFAQRHAQSRITTSNRRLTLFTEVTATGKSGPGWRITYWFYRPSLGWDRVVRLAGPAEVGAASGTRVLLQDSPRLVPLEMTVAHAARRPSLVQEAAR